MFLAEKVPDITNYLFKYADPILATIYILHQEADNVSKVFWDDVVSVLKDVYGISDYEYFEECLYVMGHAGYMHGSADSFNEDGSAFDGNRPLEPGEAHKFYMKRWVALTDEGKEVAQGVIQKANLISTSAKQKDQSVAGRIYNALEIKPGAFGISLDLKKLLSNED
jgi:hypothetical protein